MQSPIDQEIQLSLQCLDGKHATDKQLQERAMIQFIELCLV